jgi:hypothetical protein
VQPKIVARHPPAPTEIVERQRNFTRRQQKKHPVPKKKHRAPSTCANGNHRPPSKKNPRQATVETVGPMVTKRFGIA